jgi:hypothetical protein
VRSLPYRHLPKSRRWTVTKVASELDRAGSERLHSFIESKVSGNSILSLSSPELVEGSLGAVSCKGGMFGEVSG